MIEQNTRRWKQVAVTGAIVESFFKDGYRVNFGDRLTVKSDIPADARLVRTWNNPATDTVYFVYEHSSFEPVPLSEVSPTINPPTFRKEYLLHKIDEILVKHGMEDQVKRSDILSAIHNLQMTVEMSITTDMLRGV